MARRDDIRRKHARAVRREAAAIAAHRQHLEQLNNGDEFNQHDYIAAYSKGLMHLPNGEVRPEAYRSLLRAVQSGEPEDWELVMLADPGAGNIPQPTSPYPPPLPRRLKNPQAGLAYDLQGPDVAAVAIPPAPTFDSAEMAAEMAEVYWMALLRDAPFIDYFPLGAAVGRNGDTVADAVASLNTFLKYTGPGGSGLASPGNLFRGTLPGDEMGPYVSQFLLRGVDVIDPNPQPPTALLTQQGGVITFGNLRINQRQDTVRPGDFLTTFGDWLASQNRGVPNTSFKRSRRRRFVRNGRDLAFRVRPDRAYQHYLNACLILQNVDPFRSQIPDRSPGFGTDLGNPYGPTVVGGLMNRSETQEGFATFGDWHILTLLAEVSTRALQAAWYQKWFVHRRLRPEEFGGRVFNYFNGGPQYNIHPDLRNTATIPPMPNSPGLLDRVARLNGADLNFLLPQAYPEGAPLHPSYPSGHAVLAGACVTILKAHFDESLEFGPPAFDATGQRLRIGPVFQPNLDGTTLIDLNATGNNVVLTVGGELNKLASNISLGRNFGGVHFRSDYLEGVKLGEQVAIGLLQEQTLRYNENCREVQPAYYTLTRFDGTTIRIERGAVFDVNAAYSRIGSSPTGYRD